MKAIAVRPGDRTVTLLDVDEPPEPGPEEVVLRILEVGVCGTDREIAAFEYGTPPAGHDHLVLGHECLGEVVAVGSGVRGHRAGDLAVPMVRRPCTEPSCLPCRSGRADYCLTGDHVERGIKELDGFMAERVVEGAAWLHPVPSGLRDVAVLTEPLTIAEKGLAQIRRICGRVREVDGNWGEGLTAVVVGAGPVGLLGAMALQAEGFRTFVYSRSPAPNEKADLAESIGAPYVSSQEVSPQELRELVGGRIDVVYEAAGVAGVAFDVLDVLGSNGVFCLTSVARPEPPRSLDISALVRRMVLENQVMVGTVNAGAEDYVAAIAHLQSFQDRWGDAVGALITGRHPMSSYEELLRGKSTGIKNVISVAG